MGGKKVTVKDIAHLSDVSIGTVDRVMHNRGGVAEESRRKVLAAMESLGYRLNTNASLLANKKHYRIVCLLPSPNDGEYWELVESGVERARQDTAGYNITIETVNYEQFSRESFAEAVETVKENLPNAVIIAPIYRAETVALSQYLKKEKIAMVFIDSKIEEAEYLAYYGIPMYESGYLAASLLLGDNKIEQVANFRIERGASPADNPTLNRRKGFLDYVAGHTPSLQIYNEFISPGDKQYNERVFDAFFAQHPSIKHIITFNSRVNLISGYLEKHGKKGFTVVGFDLLDKNVASLKKGYVKYLIVQRTEMQLRRGVNALIDFLSFGKHPGEKDNYMPMDILVKENIDYYSEIYKE